MARRLAILAGLCLGLAVLPAYAKGGLHAKALAGAKAKAKARSEFVYIGTHGMGPGQGLFAARLDMKTGHLTSLGLAAEIVRPTWLAVNPALPVLYAVSETGNDGKSEAGVYSLTIDPATGKLSPLNNVGSGGGGATHLALDDQLKTLFVANFGTGQVSALPLQPDGSLGAVESVQQDQGTGPSPRQQGPHAHAVAVDPSHKFVLAADLGADRVFVYRFDGKSLAPAATSSLALPPGSGPRHLVFVRGRFLFMNTELTATVNVFSWNGRDGRLTPVQTLPTNAPDWTGLKSSAEMAASRNGRFLYISNRGEDTLVVYAIDRKSGRLTEIQRTPALGKTPWSFSIDPAGRWLVVANEGSSALNVFGIDKKTGKLSPTSETLQVPTPTNIAFYRAR